MLQLSHEKKTPRHADKNRRCVTGRMAVFAIASRAAPQNRVAVIARVPSHIDSRARRVFTGAARTHRRSRRAGRRGYNLERCDFQCARQTCSPVKDLLLERYAPIADGIAALFYPCAEVVIHDLRDQTIAYLVNNLSRLEVGGPSVLDEVLLRGARPHDRAVRKAQLGRPAHALREQHPVRRRRQAGRHAVHQLQYRGVRRRALDARSVHQGRHV